MGLDVIELVMEIEDEFGVQITEEDYPKLVTVGDLRDLVAVKLAVKEGWEPVGQSSFCPSAALFLWLRKGLRTTLDQPDLRIRPSEPLDAYLSSLKRRTDWCRWETVCELYLPALQHRPWLESLPLSGTLVTLLVSIAGGVVLSVAQNGDAGLILLAFSFLNSLIVGTILLALREALPRRNLPRELVTFADLVRTIGPLDWQQWQTLKRIGPAERHEEIWRRVQKIVSKQLNIPIPEIQPESRFMEDLGAG